MPVSMRAKIVKNALPGLPLELRKKAYRAINETVFEAASIAYQLCPVDTGYLRSTIAIETYYGGRILHLVVGAYYGPYVEFGTRYQEAQPFLRPATAAVVDRLNRKLGQIAAGLGRGVTTGGRATFGTR